MTTYVYQKKYKELQHKMLQLKADIQNLELEYLRVNAVAKIGERVKLTQKFNSPSVSDKIRYGYVKDREVDIRGEIYYLIYPETKAGTPSKYSSNVWSNEVLELCPKTKN